MLEIKSIPVISTAVVTHCYWVQRLIASVDFPVDNLVIFNNSTNSDLIEDLNNISKISHKFIKKITVCHMPGNVGLVTTWNLTIKSYISFPFWFFCNDDISFTPGFLAEMAKQAEDDTVGIVYGGPGDTGDGAWDIFIIRDWVIQSHGTFDENFFPGYGEDVDYAMRVHNKPIKRVCGIGKPYYHGLGMNYYESGQQTRKSDPVLAEKLDWIKSVNNDYLTWKWGENWRINEPIANPFNVPNFGISYSDFGLDFNRQKYLKF
jgi:hypothetical protein